MPFQTYGLQLQRGHRFCGWSFSIALVSLPFHSSHWPFVLLTYFLYHPTPRNGSWLFTQKLKQLDDNNSASYSSPDPKPICIQTIIASLFLVRDKEENLLPLSKSDPAVFSLDLFSYFSRNKVHRFPIFHLNLQRLPPCFQFLYNLSPAKLHLTPGIRLQFLTGPFPFALVVFTLFWFSFNLPDYSLSASFGGISSSHFKCCCFIGCASLLALHFLLGQSLHHP